MQQQASQSQSQAQSRKRPAIVVGVGAALVASAITLVIMMSNPSLTVQDRAAVASSEAQCKVIRREFLVSTTAGSGTVRLREGNYLSPPITLSTRPQSVVFPLARPERIGPEEVITIEGNATDLVLTSPVTTWRKVFDNVTGVVAFSTRWMPAKPC